MKHRFLTYDFLSEPKLLNLEYILKINLIKNSILQFVPKVNLKVFYSYIVASNIHEADTNFIPFVDIMFCFVACVFEMLALVRRLVWKFKKIMRGTID